MVEFAKQVVGLPVLAQAFEDPFFSRRPTRSRTAPGRSPKDIIATYADIVPTIPKKADVNEIVLKAVESALFSDVSAQQALTTPSRQRTR